MKIFDIIITSDIKHKTSGGPVIDDNGYVYGINTSIIRSYVTQGTAIYSALFEIIVAEREAAARRWAN